MKDVKIYGERNSGTQFIIQLIKRNFICDIIPGTLADTKSGYREQIETYLEQSFSEQDKRLWGRQRLMDYYFRYNLWNTLGWKHCLPPMDVINARNDKNQILFITLTKNPYAWILSLFRRPYDILSVRKPDHLDTFITEPWLTLERDNLHGILNSPVELWNLKTDGYFRLNEYVHVLNIKYEDVLDSPEDFLDKVSGYLEKKSKKYSLIEQASKLIDFGKKDHEYYRNYYLNQLWRDELTSTQIALIHQFLKPSTVEKAGYSMIDN